MLHVIMSGVCLVGLNIDFLCVCSLENRQFTHCEATWCPGVHPPSHSAHYQVPSAGGAHYSEHGRYFMYSFPEMLPVAFLPAPAPSCLALPSSQTGSTCCDSLQMLLFLFFFVKDLAFELQASICSEAERDLKSKDKESFRF